MKKRVTFGAGYYLYLGTRRGMRLYSEHRFVNLIWGIETLHRRQHASPSESTRLREKVDRILAQIAKPADKRWLKRQLKFVYEPTLEQRLFDTLSRIPIGLETTMLRAFCKSCADSRNDISHFGGRRQGESDTDTVQELEKRSEALGYLYHTLLLYEIGVSRRWLESLVYEGMQASTIKRAFFQAGLIDEQTLRSTTRPGPDIGRSTNHSANGSVSPP